MRLKRRAMVALLSAGAVMFAGGGAHANVPAEPVASSVTSAPAPEISPEVEAYLDTLSAEDRAEFVATMLPATTTLTYGEQRPANAAAVASHNAANARGLTVSPRATGCWTARANGSAKAPAGNTLYTYYHVGHWCASGSTVTSAKIQERGGETSTPGWRWGGAIAGSSGVVGNQGRSYSQVSFILKVGLWDVQNPTPCVRVNGLYNAAASTSSTCGIY